jgi:hypothetical protein
MAVFRSQVFFSCDTVRKWSNVYHVSATTLAIAAASWATALPSLLDMLADACQLDRILVSSLTDGSFIQTVYNQAGTSVSGGTLLPLFNSAKVVIQPNNAGRPDVKFIKGWLTEDRHSAFNILAPSRTFLDTAMTNMISDMSTNTTPLVSENGDLWVSPSVQEAVQMRQMHRRRRRST